MSNIGLTPVSTYSVEAGYCQPTSDGMAFRWRVDSGTRLYADWDAFTNGMRFGLQRVRVLVYKGYAFWYKKGTRFGLQRVHVLVYKGYAFRDENNLSTWLFAFWRG